MDDDDIDMRGVVKNGQVVLNEPLDLPDGTEVFIEVASQPPSMHMTEEQFLEFTEFFTGRNRDPQAWADFEARLKQSQEVPAAQPRKAS